MAHLVVDAMNVIGARPDGWWRDRAAAARDLLTRLAGLRAATGDPVTLVLEGRAAAGLAEGRHDGVEVVHARRRGRDAADDRVMEVVDALAGHERVVVATSDRALATRVRARGADVVGAGALQDRLDTL